LRRRDKLSRGGGRGTNGRRYNRLSLVYGLRNEHNHDRFQRPELRRRSLSYTFRRQNEHIVKKTLFSGCKEWWKKKNHTKELIQSRESETETDSVEGRDDSYEKIVKTEEERETPLFKQQTITIQAEALEMLKSNCAYIINLCC